MLSMIIPEHNPEMAANSGAEKLPRQDIFCTPNNVHFYGRASFTDLSTSRREIRLIRILPDSGKGLIECQLVHNIALDDVHGRYTALSYCAGDLQKTQTIILDGVSFNVFSNLGHALKEARHFWRKTYHEREFLLWVDQICINQTNLMERSHQVAFMRHIYQYAEQVLVCLSTKKESGRGVKWLQRLYENVPPLDDDLDADHQLEDDESIERFHQNRLNNHLWANTVDENFMKEWLAVFDILESPWWRRAWVYQEFIASSQAYFLFGRHSISWTRLPEILSSLCSIHKNLPSYHNLFLEMNEQFSWNESQDSQFRPIVARKEHAKIATEVVKFVIKSKQDWSGPADLKTLLAHSRHCYTSDDRDRIYAFLGLAWPNYGIFPDYSETNTIIEVLVESTKRIILFEDKLDVLSHATAARGPLTKHLPSWVPDWTCNAVSAVRVVTEAIESKTSFSASGSTKADASFQLAEGENDCLVLKAWAVLVDTLMTEITLTSPGSANNDPLRTFETSKGYIVMATYPAQLEDQLWVIYGARSPFILRVQDDRYRITSEAIVYPPRKWDDAPIVHLGGMVDLVERGIIARQQISIY